MKFGENDHDKDSDRHAWREYAAAWLRNSADIPDELIDNEWWKIATKHAAEMADAMLAEERKRR